MKMLHECRTSLMQHLGTYDIWEVETMEAFISGVGRGVSMKVSKFKIFWQNMPVLSSLVSELQKMSLIANIKSAKKLELIKNTNRQGVI